MLRRIATLLFAVTIAAAASAQTAAVTLSPKNNKPIDQLAGAVTITFTGLEDDGIEIVKNTIYSYTGDGTETTYTLTLGDLPHMLRFNVSPAITSAGEHSFSIPGGSLRNAYTQEEISTVEFSYTIKSKAFEDAGVTVTPNITAAPIDALEGEITVTYDNYKAIAWAYPVQPCRALICAADNYDRVITYYEARVQGNSVIFNASPALTLGGDYVVELDGFVSTEFENIDILHIPFTVTGALYDPNYRPEDDKPKTDWTYTLDPDNTQPVAEFPQRIFVKFPNIKNMGNSSPLITIEGPDGSSTYARMPNYGRIDDRTWNVHYIDRPTSLPNKPGVYTVVVPKTSVYDEDNDNYNDAFSFSYTVESTDSVISVLDENSAWRLYRLDGTEQTGAPRPGLYIQVSATGEAKIIRYRP